ncbi:SMP-30/gluconolactonase/LRE family protein [Arthrobacter sp. StoSoilB22]|uniref:SMP-30/gluconolactonase/LRE family protein n=1 Tax=Arthrobacter sp. StoSoilB22 TaxID=2830996 RepID=UPI001CC41149|nr:SMP-30/gluconolactonase/LRE family protein [Arthrobacter sp. StoSoilB22]
MLGEGILWDDRTQEIVWVDILKGAINRGMLLDDEVTVKSTVTLDGYVGAVALSEDGGMIAAGTRSLISISAEGAVSTGPDLLGDRTDVRWNDGAVDPHGRFVVGSLSLKDPDRQEILLRIAPDGRREVLRSGISLSNGVAFSPDDQTIYHVDSLTGTVSSHSYGPGDFDQHEAWTTVIADFEGIPDGLTVDANGNLWIAEWGVGAVRQFTPDGTVLKEVNVNAAQTTCPGFVGVNLDVLAITSATTGLAHPERDESGFLHLANPGATGRQTPRWAGSTRSPYWNP